MPAPGQDLLRNSGRTRRRRGRPWSGGPRRWPPAPRDMYGRGHAVRRSRAPAPASGPAAKNVVVDPATQRRAHERNTLNPGRNLLEPHPTMLARTRTRPTRRGSEAVRARQRARPAEPPLDPSSATTAHIHVARAAGWSIGGLGLFRGRGAVGRMRGGHPGPPNLFPRPRVPARRRRLRRPRASTASCPRDARGRGVTSATPAGLDLGERAGSTSSLYRLVLHHPRVPRTARAVLLRGGAACFAPGARWWRSSPGLWQPRWGWRWRPPNRPPGAATAIHGDRPTTSRSPPRRLVAEAARRGGSSPSCTRSRTCGGGPPAAPPGRASPRSTGSAPGPRAAPASAHNTDADRGATPARTMSVQSPDRPATYARARGLFPRLVEPFSRRAPDQPDRAVQGR